MATHEAPWLSIAIGELGTKEAAGDKDNPRIVAYHQTTSLKAQDDEVAWCAAFACWCLEQAGYQHPKSARARSFAESDTMTKLDKPRVGCIVVMTRKGGGHVGFLYEDKPNVAIVLGGNQGDAVTVRDFPANRVIGYYWPKPKQQSTKPTEVTNGIPFNDNLS